MKQNSVEYVERMNAAIRSNKSNLQSHYQRNPLSFVRDCGYALNDFYPSDWGYLLQNIIEWCNELDLGLDQWTIIHNALSQVRRQ